MDLLMVRNTNCGACLKVNWIQIIWHVLLMVLNKFHIFFISIFTVFSAIQARINTGWAHDKISCSQMFFKLVVFKNFANFTGKHLCWSLFLIKLQAFRPAAFLKRDSNTGVFLWSLRNFYNTFFTEHFRWLPLAGKQVKK